jgi:DNA-binding transcriptional MerR regulator
MYLKVAIMRKYSIAEISEITGLSRRTIRYYLQRGLIPSPHGAGRGRYYTEDHLARIRKIIDLQSKGMFLDEIARHLAADDVEEAVLIERLPDPAKMRLPHTISVGAPVADALETHPDLTETLVAGRAAADREIWIKVPLADGVELSVREELSTLLDDHIHEIADSINRIITGNKIGEPDTKKEKGDNDEK